MFALASWLTNTQAGEARRFGAVEVKRARIGFDTRGRWQNYHESFQREWGENISTVLFTRVESPGFLLTEKTNSTHPSSMVKRNHTL